MYEYVGYNSNVDVGGSDLCAIYWQTMGLPVNLPTPGYFSTSPVTIYLVAL